MSSVLETNDCQTQDLPISHGLCNIYASLAEPTFFSFKPNTQLFISSLPRLSVRSFDKVDEKVLRTYGIYGIYY